MNLYGIRGKLWNIYYKYIGWRYIYKYKVKLLNCEFNVYFSKYVFLDNGVYCNLIYKKIIYYKIYIFFNKFLVWIINLNCLMLEWCNDEV